MKGKIRVYCRIRPLNEKESSEREKQMLATVDEFTVEHPWKDDKRKQHIYDRVFDMRASQDDVFEDTKVLLHNTLRLPFIFCYFVVETNIFFFNSIWCSRL